MEKLNEYLQTLLSTCGYELHLEPNKTPFIVSDSGSEDVANAPLLGTQISTLIFPLIPAAVKQELPNRTEVEFVHRHNLGNFNFNIKKSSAGFNVTIRPLFSDAPGEQAFDVSNDAPELLDLSHGVGSISVSSMPPPSNFGLAASFSNTSPPENILLEDGVQLSTLPTTLFAEENQISYTAADFGERQIALDAPLIERGVEETNLTAAYSDLPPQLRELAGEYTFEIQMPVPASSQMAEPANAPPFAESETDSPLRAKMDELFQKMAEAGASDLHLSANVAPMIRKDGKMQFLENAEAPLAPEALKELLKSIMPLKNREEFAARRDTDFAYEIENLARFRANIFMDRKGMGAVFRIIPTKILTAEQLGLSKAITDLCALSKGLVVVTGPTGSGKSTTLSAMIDSINKSREDHIITIEDPIEFVHENQKCLVNQREVHNHTSGFKDALRAALREDPDIILVGEMRDLETISIALETAETGHLVFGTLHTTTAASTIDRIIDQFPADRQQQIRVMLSESLKGVVAQTLLPKIGGGRVAALEVLIVTPAISNLIREGKTFQIASAMQTGKVHGMVMLNDALFELVKKGLVEPRDAYIKAIDKSNFEALLMRGGFKL